MKERYEVIKKLYPNYLILIRYKEGVGLALGGQVQQFFAIFYLHKLHHYIKHDLHLKYINLYKLEINENKIYIIDLKMALIF